MHNKHDVRRNLHRLQEVAAFWQVQSALLIWTPILLRQAVDFEAREFGIWLSVKSHGRVLQLFN